MYNLKILLVGEFSNDPHVYTYATSFAESFERLGHQVIRYNYRGLLSPDFFPGPVRRGVSGMQDFLINQRLISAVKNHTPDIIFFLKAEAIWQRTVAQIKKISSAVILWFYPDNPFVMWNGNSNQEMLKLLPLVDTYLIWSKQLIPILVQAGAPQVQYLPFGVDPRLFWQTRVDISENDRQKYAADACFVGTWDAEREWWLTQLIERRPHLSLAIWGNRWDEHVAVDSPLRKFFKGAAVYGIEMIKAFRVAKIVLNFIRQQNTTSHNMRSIEAPASSSFLLTERTAEQANLLFKEDYSIACFATPDELAEKVDYYLMHESERQKISTNGYHASVKYSLDYLLEEVLRLEPFLQGPSNHDNFTQRNL